MYGVFLFGLGLLPFAAEIIDIINRRYYDPCKGLADEERAIAYSRNIFQKIGKHQAAGQKAGRQRRRHHSFSHALIKAGAGEIYGEKQNGEGETPDMGYAVLGRQAAYTEGGLDLGCKDKYGDRHGKGEYDGHYDRVPLSPAL